MVECCDANTAAPVPPKRYHCPVNGKEYGPVGIKTILHHLAEPWNKNLDSQAYYFCSAPDCDVVYFGQDNSVIKTSELRTKVGVKEKSPNRMVCYCFGVSYSTALKNQVAVNFIKEKTRQSFCSCKTSNPSGRCCLKDLPN
jgi:hypothetical protein